MTAVERLRATLADRYAIEREIGSGGMATVFLARDLRHERDVALKVLKPELGAVLGPDRFLSEIRVTANLQHPNLLPLFDSGSADGLLFYVMPFVVGETLRARLDREKQLPVDDSLRIATAVASALDYAHRRGIIHRDLKPENILLSEGQPLVADFGIALAVSNAGGQRVTQTGLSLGTPQYMSPEQATGDRTIDARSDVYSLGAITYEMLAGEPPHTGNSAQAVIAKLLTEEPRPLTLTRRSVPLYVDAAVHCALEKLPADRFATAAEFADALNGKGVSSRGSAARRRGSRGLSRTRLNPLLTTAALILLGGLTAFGAYKLRRPDSQMIQFLVNVPSGARFLNSAAVISPDGRTLAFTAADTSGLPFLWLRPLDRLTPYRLPGTRGARLPFWSPNSKTLGFFADGKLKSISLGDASPRTISAAPRPFGGTWNGDDVIVFSPDIRKPLYKVSAQGGEPTPVTKLHGPSSVHLSPTFLPDGKHFLFSVQASADPAGIYLGSLGSFDVTRLSPTTLAPSVSPDDYLLIGEERQLKAQKIDVSARRLTGPVWIIANDLSSPALSVSSTGVLVYRAGAEIRKNLVWMDRSGKIVETIASFGAYPALSPDQSRIAVSHNGDIWVFDRARANSATRLTFDSSGSAGFPVWSPDGRQIVFASSRTGASRLYLKSASGTGPEVDLTEGVMAFDWSRDGRFVSFFRSVGENAEDIYVLPMTGTRKAVPLIATRFSEYEPRFSPDGKWLVYTSEESGRPEIYVQTFPLSNLKFQISTNGGVQPIWSRNGREIFFLGLDGKVMSAPLTIAPRFTPGVPRALFQADADILYVHNSYEPSADGQRFVVATYAGAQAPPVAVIVNWTRLLRAPAEP